MPPNGRNPSNGPLSMRHRVHDIVHAEADAQIGEFDGIAWGIGPLPRIARILVEIGNHHDAALVVVDSHPTADAAAILGTLPEVFSTLNHETVVDVVDRVEDRVGIVDVDNGAVRKGEPDSLFEFSPLVGAMKIIGKERPRRKSPSKRPR